MTAHLLNQNQTEFYDLISCQDVMGSCQCMGKSSNVSLNFPDYLINFWINDARA